MTIVPPTLDVEHPVLQGRKPIRGSLVWWLRFLGIVAFILILLRLPHVGEDVQLTRIDLRWLGLCMLLTIGQLLLEASVWHTLLSAQRIRHPYPKTLIAYLASQYLGMVTPGHVGEFLAAGYVSSETGITTGYALSSVIMKKTLLWGTIVVFGVWSLTLLPQMPFLQGVQWAALASLLVVGVLALGIGVWVVSLRRLAKKWERLSPWQIVPAEVWSGLRALAGPQLILPLLLAVGSFSLLFVQLSAVLHALGILLPFLLVAKIIAFSRIIARIIPLSVVGFGSKDAAVIALLYQQGVEPAVGLMVTLLFLICTYLVTLLLSGLCWWIKPLVIRRVAPAS